MERRLTPTHTEGERKGTTETPELLLPPKEELSYHDCETTKEFEEELFKG